MPTEPTPTHTTDVIHTHTSVALYDPCEDFAHLSDPLDTFDRHHIANTLNLLADRACNYAHRSGFHNAQLTHSTNPTVRMLSEATKLMLITCELAEHMEALRTNPDAPSTHIPTFTAREEELADALIRLLDLAGLTTSNIGQAVLAKMAYNETRPTLHGNKKA